MRRRDLLGLLVGGQHLGPAEGSPWGDDGREVRSGSLVNNLAGNPRSGLEYQVVQRNGRTFHVYDDAGTGLGPEVVEVKPRRRTSP
jgi:hypothetical protein